VQVLRAHTSGRATWACSSGSLEGLFTNKSQR
jgi:hypothetical protein